MRTVNSLAWTATAVDFDKKIQQTLESILATPLSSASLAQASLGMKHSGLGLRSVNEHSLGAYVASLSEATDFISSISASIAVNLGEQVNKFASQLPFDYKCGMTQKDMSSQIDIIKYNNLCMDPIFQKRAKSFIRPHASSWISALPVYPNILRPQEALILYQKYLGCNLVSNNTKCGTCNTPLSPTASHTLKCKLNGDIISRHNRVRDVIFSLASSGALAPKLEKSHILGDTPGQRPADVFIPCLWNQAVAIDVAITDPSQPKYSKCKNPANDYADKVKHKKYDKGFEGSDIEFIPMVFETTGGINDEGLKILEEIVHRAAVRSGDNVGVFKALAWQRLSITLQRSNARMIRARIPTPPDF
jgi:hypothetical protein